MIRVVYAIAVSLASLVPPAAANDLVLSGDPIQGGLMHGQTMPGAQVVVNGRPVRVSADGGFVFGFHRDQGPQAVVEARRPDGTIDRRYLDVRQRRYQVQHINRLPQNMVTFTDEILARIRADAARARAARRTDSPEPYYADGFAWPLDGPITGVFGSQRVLNGEPRSPHYGVDIAAPAGTPVMAAGAGVVALVDDGYLAGLTIILDHGHGLTSSYLHLQSAAVAVGDKVSRGQPIGAVGSSGRSTGAHLDWRVNWFDARLDPALVAPPPAH